MDSSAAEKIGGSEPVDKGLKGKLKPGILDREQRELKKQAKEYVEELNHLNKEGYGLAIIVGNDGREKRFIVDLDDSFFIQDGKARMNSPGFVTEEAAGANKTNPATEAELTIEYRDGEEESVEIAPEPDKVTHDSVTGIPKIYFSERDALPIDMRKAAVEDPREMVNPEQFLGLLEQARFAGMQSGPDSSGFEMPDWVDEYGIWIATFVLAAVFFAAKESGYVSV